MGVEWKSLAAMVGQPAPAVYWWRGSSARQCARISLKNASLCGPLGSLLTASRQNDGWLP